MPNPTKNNHATSPINANKSAPTPVVRTPRVDILTNPSTVRVRADLPGVSPETLELSLHRSTLHIDGKGTRQRFLRAISLPWPIHAEADIDAQLKNGLLTVDLVRRDAPRPARRIPVS